MRTGFLKKMVVGAMAIVIFGFAPAWSAQDKPADNMQILRDKIRADKKLVVATNMELTESEAKGFWPVYDAYQKDLQRLNQRLANLLESYATDLDGKSLTDDKARKLVDEAVSIEQAEAKLKSAYAPKLSKPCRCEKSRVTCRSKTRSAR